MVTDEMLEAYKSAHKQAISEALKDYRKIESVTDDARRAGIEAAITEMAKEAPKILTQQESDWLMKISENLVKDILEDNLGGYSGINRPFHVKHMIEVAIEKIGNRDVGLKCSYNELKEIGLE